MTNGMATSRPGVIVLAPRPGTRRWTVLPVDARELESEDEAGAAFASAEAALQAARQVIDTDPFRQFSAFMEEYVRDAESRGQSRDDVLAHMRSLLHRVVRGGQEPLD